MPVSSMSDRTLDASALMTHGHTHRKMLTLLELFYLHGNAAVERESHTFLLLGVWQLHVVERVVAHATSYQSQSIEPRFHIN